MTMCNTTAEIIHNLQKQNLPFTHLHRPPRNLGRIDVGAIGAELVDPLVDGVHGAELIGLRELEVFRPADRVVSTTNSKGVLLVSTVARGEVNCLHIEAELIDPRELEVFRPVGRAISNEYRDEVHRMANAVRAIISKKY